MLNKFSFEGRIRRSEYAFSFIFTLIMDITIQRSSAGMVFFLIPLFWFFLAQGAKRCHDLGNSGWWQLIPFYGFWMLFANSQKGVNEYGKNPKGIGNEEEEEKETRA